MAWPTALDYQEALQNPNMCFNDAELKTGTPLTDKMGLPKPDSGTFASVYRIKNGQKDWAVKCFLREISDQQQRYSAISQHLSSKKLQYTVGFEYLPQGIKIRGQWYPIVKMEWVNGEHLGNFIKRNIHNPSLILHLANRWVEMVKALQQANIAHGDLQHGNVLVVNGDFRLIDYDGMYVPSLSGRKSHELGHQNYQHPHRNENDFDLYIDNFSSWVIYISLISLVIDPNLWDRPDAGEENLLFRREDFEQPDTSIVLHLLEQKPDPSIQYLVSTLKSFIYSDLSNIPSLSTIRVNPNATIPISESKLPDWVQSLVSVTEQKQFSSQQSDLSNSKASWLFDYMKSDPLVLKQFSCIPEYIALGISASCIISASATLAIGLLAPLISILGISATIAVFTGFLALRYRQLNEVSHKRSILKNLVDIQNEIQEIEATIKQFDFSKEILNKDAEKRINEIKENQHKCNQKEKDEISIIDNDLYKDLTQLNTKLQDIDNLESNELSSALINIQNQFISKNLQSYDFNRAKISGIGNAMKAKLKSAGIKCAEDIINVHITNIWDGGYSHDIAYIEIVGHGKVYIDGIDPVKANDILTWKRNLESRIRNNAPQKLDQSQIASIKSKYQSQKSSLQYQITTSKQNSELKKNNVRQEFSKEFDTLNKCILDIKAQNIKACNDIEQNIIYKRKLLSKKNWSLGKLQKDLSTYKDIDFLDYIKHIVKTLKQNLLKIWR